MADQETLPLETVPETPRLGRDELNLTEFPFCLLSSKGLKDPPLVLKFQVEKEEKEWMISGHAAYGLPTAADSDVYVVLMEITKEQRFPERIYFSRYDLLRRLGWDTSASSYDRLVLAFHRLQGITISTKNAFFDAKNRRWERERAIGILASFDITGSRSAPPEEAAPHTSWFTWNPELYMNMRAGYLKALDIRLFLSLKSAVTKQLYRYLDRRRGGDGKIVFRIGLKQLAWEHLGLSRNYYPSQIKRKLQPAHQELIEVGFLVSAEYAPMMSQPGEEQVVYRFATPGTRKEFPQEQKVLPEPVDPLAQRLIDAGLSRQVARELAAADPGACEAQLAYLPYREARDPGAVLAKAIREGWAAPPGWTQAQVQQKARVASQRKRQETAARAEQAEKEEAAFETWWKQLPAGEREAILAEARTVLRQQDPVAVELASKRPEGPLMRAVVCRFLKQRGRWPVHSG